MDSTLDVPSMGQHLADFRRIAFVSHAGGEIVLRPISRFDGSEVVPRRLLPGDQFFGLTFAQLASAFQGVVAVAQEECVYLSAGSGTSSGMKRSAAARMVG